MFVNLRKKLQRDTVSGQKSFNGTNPQVDGGHRSLTEEPYTSKEGLASSSGSEESLVDFSLPNQIIKSHISQNDNPVAIVNEQPPIIAIEHNSNNNNSSSDTTSKKSNGGLDRKLKVEILRKRYEKHLQEQEETFSWTVRSKDNELTVLRNERDALTQQVTVLEANWQTKLARVTADFEQMLELARLENTKVKHLLLNTQSELEAANVRVAELESKLKNNHDDHVREETVKLAQQQTEITSLRKQLEDLTRTLSNGHSN